MPETQIAKAVGLPVSRVRTISQSVRYLQPEDKELADGIRDLAWKALREADDIIQWGAPAEKYGLIKTIIARTAGMVGQETTTRYDEMRNEFEDMITRMVDVDDDVDEAEVVEP